MAKVEFKRVETDAEIEDIDIKDGQLIYSKSGKTYMDYGTERIPTGSGGSSVTVDTEMSDTSENAVQNKVIKEYVDSQTSEITNEYSTSTGLGYSANYTNIMNTYSTDEVRIGTWVESDNTEKPYYMKIIRYTKVSGTDLSIILSDVEDIKEIDARIILTAHSNYAQYLPLYESSSINGRYLWRTTENRLTVATGTSDWCNGIFEAIIKYTKVSS